MNERYLLDTAITGLLSQSEPAIQQKLAQAQAFYVPLFAIAELEYGALYYLARRGTQKYLNRYTAFMTTYGRRVILPSLDTSHIYVAIAAELKAAGKPMQANDIWIAALARQYGPLVLTKDGDFKRISNLNVEVV